jgi:hypothetical protein
MSPARRRQYAACRNAVRNDMASRVEDVQSARPPTKMAGGGFSTGVVITVCERSHRTSPTELSASGKGRVSDSRRVGCHCDGRRISDCSSSRKNLTALLKKMSRFCSFVRKLADSMPSIAIPIASGHII